MPNPTNSVLAAVVSMWADNPLLMAYTPATSGQPGGLWTGEIPENLVLTPGKVFACLMHDGEVPEGPDGEDGWTFENVWLETTTLHLAVFALGDGTAGNDSLSLAEKVSDLIKATYDWAELPYFTPSTHVAMRRVSRKIDPVTVHAPTGEIVFQDLTEWRATARKTK